MQKTITIDGREITFKSNAALPYAFKAQFGYDMMTKILPVISEILSGLDVLMESIPNSDEGEGFRLVCLADAFDKLYSLEITDVQNLIWTMAKLGNADIQEPVIWYSKFEEFDMFEVLKELTPVFLSSFVAKKNLERIRAAFKKIDHLTLKQSSQELSQEA